MRLSPEELRRQLAANPDLHLVTDADAYTTLEPSGAFATPEQTPMHIELPYPPSANVYWRMTVNRDTGGCMMVRSAAATKYVNVVAYYCKVYGLRPLSGDVRVRLHVYRPQRSGDLDNRIKVVLDALQGYAYANDEQIVEIHAKRGDDKDNPRVEIEISPLEPI